MRAIIGKMKIVDVDSNVHYLPNDYSEYIVKAISQLHGLHTLKFVGEQAQIHTLNNVQHRRGKLMNILKHIFIHPLRKFDEKNPIDHFSVDEG